MRLWKYIKEIMLKNPQQYVCENLAKMSYEELVVFAEVFAEKLVNEKCCAILCGSEMATGMAILSCFAAGVTAVPLSVKYGELHCNRMLDVIGPTAVITDMDTRLIAPFTLETAQNVQVQILMDGVGTVYADAAQLENNV